MLPTFSQESLGFLNAVVPRRVVQRMLSAAVSLGPLAAADVPAPEAAAAAVAAAGAAGEAAQPMTPATPSAGGGRAPSLSSSSSAASLDEPSGAALPQPAAAKAGWVGPQLELAPAPETPPGPAGSPGTSGHGGAVARGVVATPVNTLRQKWNLEFA